MNGETNIFLVLVISPPSETLPAEDRDTRLEEEIILQRLRVRQVQFRADLRHVWPDVESARGREAGYPVDGVQAIDDDVAPLREGVPHHVGAALVTLQGLYPGDLGEGSGA